MSKEIKTFTPSAITDIFTQFFSQFKDDDGKYKYLDMIDSLGERNSFLVNTLDLSRSNNDKVNELFNMLCDTPYDILNSAYHSASQIHAQRFPNSQKKIFVMFDESFYKSDILNTLGNKFIGKLITTNGMVMSMSEKYTIPNKLFYKCPDKHITVINMKIGEDAKSPVVCDTGNCKHRDFDNITSTHKDASFEQYRLLSLKSQNEFSLNEDELQVLLINDLVDYVQIGDNVRVTGIVYPHIVDNYGKKKSERNMFQTRLICSFIENIDKIDYKITEDDIVYFEKFIQDDDFYSRLVNSIAPSIYGMSNVKESILLQRVGGYFPEKDGKKTREFFIIGLWGSAGMAKSELGIWCEKELPKTKMVQSRGATAKGLLLGLEDSIHGGKTLRAGTMVICQNGGVVILDEYTRLQKETREELYSTMESGFADISKSGHTAKARADAGIYATGNAFEGEWDKNATLIENLHMDSAELQRFDFHWIVIDEHDPHFDEKIADIILEHYDSNSITPTITNQDKKIPVDILIKYIEYVKRFKPIMTEESKQYLKKTYLKLRSSTHNKNTSPRILNTLVRTATAIARIHQKNIVDVDHIDKTITLIQKMLSQQGISIDEADTYLTRQFNNIIQILHDDKLFPNGMSIEQIMTKMHSNGSLEDIQKVKMDLGDGITLSTNKKLRILFEKVKKSRYVSIIQNKPMLLLYKRGDSGTMDEWN